MSTTKTLALLLAPSLFACAGQANKPAAPPKISAPVHSSAAQALPAGAAKGYERVMASQTLAGHAILPDSRATALVVFASWCGHCKAELAQLTQLRERYPDLRIIGVNAYEEFQGISNQTKLMTYVAANAPWLTEIVSADAAMLEDFGKIPKIPTLFLYDGQGQVVAEYRRNKRPAPSNEELSAAIEKAMLPAAPTP